MMITVMVMGPGLDCVFGTGLCRLMCGGGYAPPKVRTLLRGCTPLLARSRGSPYRWSCAYLSVTLRVAHAR